MNDSKTVDKRNCDLCGREWPKVEMEHEVDHGFGPGCTEHNYYCPGRDCKQATSA